MRAIVIGGAGFIGHHLVKKLLSENIETIVIDNLSTGKIENVPVHIEFHNIDITKEDIDFILNEGDVVFHFAAMARVQPSIIDPIKYNEVNVNGLLKVLVSCVNKKVGKFVFSSSSSVFGNAENLPTNENEKINPISPYALQKYFGEEYCKLFTLLYGLDTVILRYFNVYGENMPLEGAYRTVLSIFGNQYKNNEPFTLVNDGNQKRDFTYVNDVVDANFLVGFSNKKWVGESFNIGNGKSISIKEIISYFGVDNIVNIGDKIEPYETLADNKKAKELLGWNPTGDIKTWIEYYKKTLK
jgi:UDP-glucose 4-epimerase